MPWSPASKIGTRSTEAERFAAPRRWCLMSAARRSRDWPAPLPAAGGAAILPRLRICCAICRPAARADRSCRLRRALQLGRPMRWNCGVPWRRAVACRPRIQHRCGISAGGPSVVGAVMLHGRASMRWTHPECQESFAPAVYGFPPETQWAGFSLEWHLLPAYLLNIAVLRVAPAYFLVPLRRYKWMRSRGGIVGMLASWHSPFPIVTKAEQPHIMPSAAFPIAGWQHLKAALVVLPKHLPVRR